MSELSDIVGILLMRNNCVVIPNFGGFVASLVSAQVDVSKGIITPPKKALSFNRNLNNNDGLLISTLAQENRTSFDDASKIVTDKVDQIKSALNKGERVHFQNVGFLYINKAGSIAFEQDRFFNLLLSSYGLSNVHFVAEDKTVESSVNTDEIDQPKIVAMNEKKEQESKTKKEPVDDGSDNVKEIKPRTNVLKTIVKYAAAAAFIPIVFYSFWIPMKTDVLQSGVIFSQDFNPFNKADDPKYQQSAEKKTFVVDSVQNLESMEEITAQLSKSTVVFSYPLDDDLFVPVKIKGSNTVEVLKEPINSDLDSKKYQLIVGCFSQKRNATDLVKELKKEGFNSFIVDFHEGLHRVSAAQSNSKEDLKIGREKLKSNGLPSWILNK